jgi:hypothetical protein
MFELPSKRSFADPPQEAHLKINYRERGARTPFSFLKNFKQVSLDIITINNGGSYEHG